ncbi:MAG: HD domain-containing protein [Bacilli bacterium]|nr:HD domain-containing protein [Bacilli bacterium]
MMKYVNELIEGDIVETQFLIGSSNKCINNMGSYYYNLELKDYTGAIPGKKWEAKDEDEAIFAAGNIIYAKVEVLKYKESLQAKVVQAKVLSAKEVDITRFVKSAPRKKEELVDKLNSYIISIKNPDCLKLVNYFINKDKEKIFNYPAASSIHHEYASGLLMHTVSMLELGEFCYKQYPDINYDLLMSGIILHDLGKTIELEGDIVFKYSLEGRLLGHISIMAAEIRKAADKLAIKSDIPMLLEHIVLAHHGQLEYGSPVMPLTREAFLVNLIDNLDSKMTILTKALEGVEKGEFSQKVFALDNRSFYKS